MIACTRGIELLEELERAAAYKAIMRCARVVGNLDATEPSCIAYDLIRSEARALKAKGKR